MHTAFTPYSRQAYSSEWRAQIAQKPAIDPSDSGPQLFGHAMAALDVICPNRSCQSIFCIIGECNRSALQVEWRDMANWPKNFFFSAASRFRKARKDCRLDVKPLVAAISKVRDAAARDHCRPFFARQFIVAEDFLA